MFGFIKNMFITTMMFVGFGALNTIPLKCVSINNQECKARPAKMNINSNESLFYPYIILVNKCSGSCNNINDPYAKLCLPGVVKNINIKAFNLMSRTNETRHMSLHETCGCKCRLDASVYDNAGLVIDADVNAKNWFTMVDVMMNSFEIVVYVNVNMINHVMLVNIFIMQIVNVEKF